MIDENISKRSGKETLIYKTKKLHFENLSQIIIFLLACK